MFNRLLQI